MPASHPQQNPESGGEAERVRCLYCGANNFPASPTCWQCGRPLKPMGGTERGGADTSAASIPAVSGALGAGPAPPVGRAGAFTRGSESALAPKVAAAMGLMFPVIGIPLGMVFLMLDDPRKTQLGWTTIIWSVIGSILNAVLFFLTLAPLLALLQGLMPHGGGAPQGLPSGVPGGIPGLPDGLKMFNCPFLPDIIS